MHWRDAQGRAYQLLVPDWPERIAGRRSRASLLMPRAAELVAAGAATN
jgi:hypothetical protein